ncbi:signal peptide peptidase SppA [Chthonobacter albigriseus]|uniref:signal peptide peptidase SppA n=1 Tax=Chthonobacter albigriseus TaxID=1683161 RepID=UPI0015EFC3EB|nr:signal peptide peptidase SppA [Chthonobacter albigriseus]
MSLDADAIVDRRRIRRKLAFWRIAAFLLAVLAVLGAIAYAGGFSDLGRSSPHIARITVDGVIMEDRQVTEMIERIGDSDWVEGVIVAIDSPGGSTTGGEALYDSLRKLAEKKPTVATIGTLAASAGYMTAIAADHIVAGRTSITGSIGVYFQYGSVVGLLDKIGVEVKTVKSAPLKAEPSPFTEPEVPGAREMIGRLVDDTYQWFVDIVAERRGLDRAEALRLADGSIFSGRQALGLKLVDEIGGETEAVAWLEKERGVTADLPVEDWKPRSATDRLGLGSRAVLAAGRAVGLDLSFLVTVPTLDGLVSVWHPQLSDTE